MNVIDLIIKFFPGITSFGPWLSKKGIIYAGMVGVGLAFSLIVIGFIPAPPADPNATTFPLWHVLYLVGFPLLFVVIWFGLTQIYLRSGRGTKIGLAYDGHAVDMCDWKRTKNKLCTLLKNGKIKNRVTLRFVPLSNCTEAKLADEFKQRYGFSILITVQQSPLLKNDRNNAQHPIPMEITPNIATTVEAKQFLQTTVRDILEINKTRNLQSTLANVLEAQAQDLHDMMLLFVASHCYLKKRYEDSAVILQYLDDSLSALIRPDRNPRRQIRRLAMNSWLQPTRFLLQDIPQPDKLREIREFAETALPFFDDSFFVPTDLGRIRFLTGDIEGAIDLTNKFKEKIVALEAAGQKPARRALVVYYLNSGFLSFIQGHWVNAYDAYKKMLAIDEYRNELWDAIIIFIDYVQALECYEGICYLQMLYRLIARKPVPVETQKAAQEWVEKDDSRQELCKLFSRNYASLPKASSQKALKSKKQGGKSKQRSKRKIKPRKGKRRKR